MTILKEWTICICLTLLVATIFSLLIPNENMGSFYKIVISLFVFLSFVFPLKDTKLNDFNLDLGSFNQIYDNSAITSNMIETQISNFLKNNSIFDSIVNVDAIQNEYEIEIKSVKIEIPKQYKKDEVKELIFNELGINAEVKSIGN